MIVNETIIQELVSHFRRIINKYEEEYKDSEEFYLSDEINTLYIDEILIRAYFYAKGRKQVKDFYDFIDNFVNPSLVNAETNLADWLKEEFGIQFVSDASLGVRRDKHEETILTQALTKEKNSPEKAKTDAKLILTIYAQRALRNEISSESIFGYKTWWLSKDTLTQKTVNKVFKDKYKISCYMRPDFLYNYVSLAPTKTEVDAAYNELFPSLLGVNISSHLPKDVTDLVHQRITEHSTKNPTRLKAILRELAEKLKADPTSQSRQYVEHYLDSKLRKATGNRT
jgi:hypothetical protein